jgi:predicted DNA-binding antitoxin AbrB/MazE fold protein
MTTETLEAIFEHGTFRLVRQPSLPLRDGQRVRLVIETEESPETILALDKVTGYKLQVDRIQKPCASLNCKALRNLAFAASVYEGLSPQEITELEQIALQRRDFFGEDA